MRIYHAEHYDDMSRKAANILSAQVILKPASVLGLSTGSTPIGLYRQLAEWYRKGDVDFSGVTTVNLDEYQGLAPDDPQSYARFMRENFFDHINVKLENTHLPDGLAADAERECVRYEAILRNSGGLDMLLLGIGHNGHIGFNEPGSAFEKGTHLVTLTQSTIEANRRFFRSEDDVPRHAYTMGIRSIMQARTIVVIVSGASKAGIVHRAFTGPVTPEVPASVLQLHNDVILVGDREAMRLLTAEV
ncbi:MAG: glucosamine-6-phosphate deaminase [Oscillospiraceae bacterium]|jgi:glucosamine-6-phosphate deaminase|nr:glucosamine-6-phosphate deaminase [Oscillospiraceae bacterium]